MAILSVFFPFSTIVHLPPGHAGYPIFPGEDESDQLALIVELLGLPPQKLLDGSKRAKNFISSKGYPRYCSVTQLPDGGVVLNGGRSRRGKVRGPPASKDMVTALKGCDDSLFVDFMRRCLDWDPATRLTPAQALRHPWLRRRLPKPPQSNNNTTTHHNHNNNNHPTASTSAVTAETGAAAAPVGAKGDNRENRHHTPSAGGGGAVGGLAATAGAGGGGGGGRELRGTTTAGNRAAVAAAAAAGSYGAKEACSVRAMQQQMQHQQMQQQMGAAAEEMPSPRTKLPQISHAVL